MHEVDCVPPPFHWATVNGKRKQKKWRKSWLVELSSRARARAMVYGQGYRARAGAKVRAKAIAKVLHVLLKC